MFRTLVILAIVVAAASAQVVGACGDNSTIAPNCTAPGIYADSRNSTETEFGVCSQYWMMCGVNATNATCNKCAGDLWFDVELGVCAPKHEVPDCNNGTRLENSTAFNATCAGLKAGFYAAQKDACDSTFFTCDGSNDSALVGHCVNGTFVDVIGERCTFAEFVDACGGDSAHEFKCFEQGVYPDLRHETETEFGVCSQYWMECLDNATHPTIRKCAPGLWFDMELGECWAKADVPDCNNGTRPELPVITPAEFERR